MLFMAFEILINLFEAFLELRYVKACFEYEKKTPLADAALVLAVTAFYTIYLFYPAFPLPHACMIVFAGIHAMALSRENKASVILWLLVLLLVFNLVSVLFYPIIELLPILLGDALSSGLFKRFIALIVTNAMLFAVLELVIRIKKKSTIPRTSSYVMFILTLAGFCLMELFIYELFLAYSSEAVIPFLVIYLMLLGCVLFTIFLLYAAGRDSEREHRYRAEIAMLNLSRQHQEEMARMYEELTRRQHDYKHHLGALQEMVGRSDPATAKDYLSALVEENAREDAIMTGSPGVDALLAAKRRAMDQKGIRLVYTPYPLFSLPISELDFRAVLGNLLDNAIEGVQRLPDAQAGKAEVRLSFSRSWDMLYIYCENPCDPAAVVRKKGRFVSSKRAGEPGLHGIGLRSVEAIASRADGRAEFAVSGDVFRAKVVLPFLSGKV